MRIIAADKQHGTCCFKYIFKPRHINMYTNYKQLKESMRTLLHVALASSCYSDDQHALVLASNQLVAGQVVVSNIFSSSRLVNMSTNS